MTSSQRGNMPVTCVPRPFDWGVPWCHLAKKLIQSIRHKKLRGGLTPSGHFEGRRVGSQFASQNGILGVRWPTVEIDAS